MKAIRAIRGMSDILPDDIALWHLFEDTARRVFTGYGYAEIRPPLLERTELFQRSIGEVTDIVEKEMYTFADRNGELLTLRPECTASCVRAAVEHGLLRQQDLRIWYRGPMFRYERPQKGRYRQFHQVGAEAFGDPGPLVDAELILMTARLWRELGLDSMRLEINSLGTRTEQAAYRAALVAYLETRREALDEDSLRRLGSNPLRVLDSKNPHMRPVLDQAPSILDHLGAESRAHFDGLRASLADSGVDAILNPRLVRGLDYYTRTVFEWVSDALGAQNATCGGGRYDALVREIGGPDTPGVGFSIGVERVIETLRAAPVDVPTAAPAVYFAAVGERACTRAHGLAERLRDALPSLAIRVDAGSGSFRAKLRRADRGGARVAALLGDDELDAGTFTLKALRGDAEQTTVDFDSAPAALARMLDNPE